MVALAAPFTVLVDMVVEAFGPSPPRTPTELTPAMLVVLWLVPTLVGIVAQLTVAILVDRPDGTPRSALAAALAATPVCLISFVIAWLPLGLGMAFAYYGRAAVSAPLALAALLLMISGLYVVIRMFPVAPVVVLERGGVVASLRRCWALTAGNGWQIVVLIIMLTLFQLGALFLAQGVGAAFAALLTLIALKPVGVFVAALCMAATGMLVSIGTATAATVIYLKLR